jgi:hypothetical protein
LALTKAIQSITKQQEGFEKAVEKCKELIADDFGDIETRLEAKRKELSELEAKFEYDEQNRKVELDLRIKEHGYETAKSLLAERDEVAVAQEEYDRLQMEVKELRESKEREIKAALEAEASRNAKHVQALSQMMELKNQAEVAKVQAQLETQVNQIELLKETITDLKASIDEQRKLTKDVAQASAKNQPMYIPQASSGR